TEGAKYLLQSSLGKSKSFLTVVDAIDVPDEQKLAIESALGEAAVYIIVEKLADVFGAIEELKKEDKGKATFVCLERIPAITRTSDLPNVRWAKDVIKCKPQFRKLFDFL